MDIVKLYKQVVNIKYIEVENKANYAIEKRGDTLYLYFQCSNGREDWINNFDFPAVPYSDMGIKWKCHRGFLKIWKSIKPYLRDVVKDASLQHIVIAGYSQGAAIAALAHEYVWFNRPDIRNNIVSYAFGCPRCFWGPLPTELKERWENFNVINNKYDIVGHVPPRLFGFRDLGTKTIIDSGCRGLFGAHYPEEYCRGLANSLEF